MNLLNEKRVASPECFVCRWAGHYIVVWPQDPLDRPQAQDNPELEIRSNPPKTYLPPAIVWTAGKWMVYYNVHESREWQHENRIRSRRCEVIACHKHWVALFINWQSIVREELDLDRGFNAYIERMER